jgi:hypothetical protein
MDPSKGYATALLARKHGDTWCVVLFQNTPAAYDGRPQPVQALTEELRRVAAQR